MRGYKDGKNTNIRFTADAVEAVEEFRRQVLRETKVKISFNEAVNGIVSKFKKSKIRQAS